MNPQPLRIRILRALELAPMTVRDLSRCLCASVWSIRAQVAVLRAAGDVSCKRTETANGRPWNLYGIAV